MDAEVENIKELLRTVPIFLEGEPVATKVAMGLLPFNTGIEIECYKSPNYDVELFKKIPGIVDVQVDDYEQRYQIPSGLDGMICLYRLCEMLKTYSMLNEGSGIHLHVGMYDEWKHLNYKTKEENTNWILQELDSWGYKGTYNYRSFSSGASWIRSNSDYKTVEVRICEMTFDYEVLIKRILHFHKIVRRLKLELVCDTESELRELEMLQKELEEPEQVSDQQIVQIVKSRKIRL